MKDQGSGKIKRYEWTAKKPPPPGSNPSENEAIPDSMLPDRPKGNEKKVPDRSRERKKRGR